MPKDAEKLAFVTTDELLDELKNRCQMFYLLMIPNENSVADWRTAIYGNVYTLFGMLEASKQFLLGNQPFDTTDLSDEDAKTDEDE